MSGEGFGKVDLRESATLLEHAFDRGLRRFDTANIYSHGQAECLLGKVFASHRKDIYLSSKAGLRWDNSLVVHDATSHGIKESCYQSLERLKTSYLDCFFLHWIDPKCPISESISALKELQQEGVVLDYGICNFDHDALMALPPRSTPLLHQVHFNPIHAQTEVLNVTKNHHRGLTVATSPLEQGLLSEGQSQHGLLHLGKKDLRRRNPYFHHLSLLKKLASFRATYTKFSVSSLVLSWLFQHPLVDFICVGPKTLSQLKVLLDVETYLDAALEYGHTSGAFDAFLSWKDK